VQQLLAAYFTNCWQLLVGVFHLEAAVSGACFTIPGILISNLEAQT